MIWVQTGASQVSFYLLRRCRRWKPSVWWTVVSWCSSWVSASASSSCWRRAYLCAARYWILPPKMSQWRRRACQLRKRLCSPTTWKVGVAQRRAQRGPNLAMPRPRANARANTSNRCSLSWQHRLQCAQQANAPALERRSDDWMS